MAQLQVTIKDAVYASALATFPGVDNAERLVAFKQFVRERVRDRIRLSRELEAREAANVAARNVLAGLDAELAD